MTSRSVISLNGEDREEISSSVLHEIWKERWQTCHSTFGSELPGPYFQFAAYGAIDSDRSNLLPNLTVVNPQKKYWKVPESYASGDESVFDGLWRGNAMTIQRSSATEPLPETSSDSDELFVHRKGVVQIVRPTERDTSLVCRWDGSIEESIVDSIRALSEACDFTESIDLHVSLLATDKLHHPQRLLELIRDDFGTSVAIPVFLFVSSDVTSSQNIANSSSAMNSVFGEIARASALQSIFAECTDTASLLLPMHVPVQSGLLSQALDTALSFRLPQRTDDNPEICGSGASALRTSDWAKRCSVDGYLPVVFLEGGPSLSSVFPRENIFSSLQQISPSRMVSCKSVLSNPFLSSFAPRLPMSLQRNDAMINQRSGHNAVAEDDSDNSDEDMDSSSMVYDMIANRRYERPLSNFVSLRVGYLDSTTDRAIGPQEAGAISQELFMSCLQSPYLVSGVSIAAGLPASITSPPLKTVVNSGMDISYGGLRGAEGYRQRLREREEESVSDYATDSRYYATTSQYEQSQTSEMIRDARVNRNNSNHSDSHAQSHQISDSSENTSNEFMICASAVTASRDTGRYLTAHRRHWRHSLQSCSSSLSFRLRVLDMLQYEVDDIDRVSDSLLSLSERYLSYA